jgi:hypothetical protein
MMNRTEEQFAAFTHIEKQLKKTLAAHLHKQWLRFTSSNYSKEAHAMLVDETVHCLLQ